MPVQEQLTHRGFKCIMTFMGFMGLAKLDQIAKNQIHIYRAGPKSQTQ